MNAGGVARLGFPEGGPAYLNNASVSPTPLPAIRAVSDFMSAYSAAGPDSAASGPLVDGALDAARAAVAGIIRCRPEELVLTQSTTDGVNIVAQGLRLPAGSSVVIRGMGHEHHANLYPWLNLRGRAEVRSLPIDADGFFEARRLEEALDGGTRLVALSHALYNTGAILPVEEAGELLRARGVPYFVDAAQTVGCAPVDVGKIGCDFMAFNGSKWLCGPMGTGMLYCRGGSEGLLEPAAVGGESATLGAGGGLEHRGMPARLQAGFRNYAGMAGLASSARLLSGIGIGEVRRRAVRLAGQLRDELSRMPGAVLYGPGPEELRTSIVPFNVGGRDPRYVAERLERAGVVVAVREAGDREMVRASPHFFNTEDEVQAAADALRSL